MTALPAALIVLAAVAPSGAEDSVSFPLDLQDPNGGRIQLLSSDPALHLVFFATWCPPCMQELPGLAELEARWGGRGYRLMIIGVPTRQSAARLSQLVEQHDPPGQVVFDATGRVTDSCGVRELPTHLIIDASGRIMLRAAALDEDVEAAVAELLRAGRG